MTNERLNIEPGNRYGTDVTIEIISVEIQGNTQNLRRAVARVLTSTNHWQSLGDRSLKPGNEIELQEIMDNPATEKTHWILAGNLPWFVLGQHEGNTSFEHYR